MRGATVGNSKRWKYKNRKPELNKTGIAPVGKCTKKEFSMDSMDLMDHMDAVMLKSPSGPFCPSGPSNADY